MRINGRELFTPIKSLSPYTYFIAFGIAANLGVP
ncbi:hypothetical protein Barb6_03244 [Bacteroidales bacterium Barb6]|nr:hypothetical protein Barb6_03244 [Bacteroidales bacterium Barb6]